MRETVSTLIGYVLLGSLLLFCAQKNLGSWDSSLAKQDSVPVLYRLEEPPRSVGKLKALYSVEQVALLEKLNRADVNHLSRLKVLVIPERWDLDELSYSPLPARYPWAEPYPKLLVVHPPSQVFGGYEGGRLVMWGPLSSGSARDPTPQGLFHLNWKSPGRHSTENPEWYMRWYYNFSNSEGRAFHAYSLPGYPASHACIRLLKRDAQWLYHWGESWELGAKPGKIQKNGTPVLILGQFQFDEPPPWRSLQWLARRLELPPDPLVENSSVGTGFGLLTKY
jgi:hypothetical protein